MRIEHGWAFKLALQLTGKVQLAYAAMSVEDTGNYNGVKIASLRWYSINKETYYQRWTTTKKASKVAGKVVGSGTKATDDQGRREACRCLSTMPMLKLDIRCVSGTKPVGIMNSKMGHGTKAGSKLLQLWTKGTYFNMMLNQCIVLWRKGKSFTGAESHQHGVIEG